MENAKYNAHHLRSQFPKGTVKIFYALEAAFDILQFLFFLESPSFLLSFPSPSQVTNLDWIKYVCCTESSGAFIN